MGPIWGRQDPGGPHVGPTNFAIWDGFLFRNIVRCLCDNLYLQKNTCRDSCTHILSNKVRRTTFFVYICEHVKLKKNKFIFNIGYLDVLYMDICFVRMKLRLLYKGINSLNHAHESANVLQNPDEANYVIRIL